MKEEQKKAENAMKKRAREEEKAPTKLHKVQERAKQENSVGVKAFLLSWFFFFS